MVGISGASMEEAIAHWRALPFHPLCVGAEAA